MYDVFTVNIEKIDKKDSDNLEFFKEIIRIPQNLIFSFLFCNRTLSYSQFLIENENGGGYSLYRKSEYIPGYDEYNLKQNLMLLPSLEEAFIILPIQQTQQSMVIFFSKIEFGGNAIFTLKDYLKLARMNVLIGLREFVQDKKKCKSEYSYTKNEEVNNMLMEKGIENENNIHTQGKFVPLEKRLPRYHKYKKRGIWCNNKEDLRYQDEVILELYKIVGTNPINRENYSLPVKVFEGKSMLERIAELWGTGAFNLPKAANSKDYIERLKYVITFVISGLYTAAVQRKPFNPILGETLQGYWPNGTRISIEQISNIPPISYFYVSLFIKLLINRSKILIIFTGDIMNMKLDYLTL